MDEARKMGEAVRREFVAVWRRGGLVSRMQGVRNRGEAAFLAADDILRQRGWLWTGLVAGLTGFVFLYFAPRIGGNWYRGGNDMEYILPAAKAALPQGWGAAREWIDGPWIGKELFVYYRPVTSVVWYALYRSFGESSAPWQALGVALHAGSAVMLACLLRRVFGSPLAALAAAFLWAMRDKMGDALQWTPAMTDILAGFFGIAALWALQTALDTRRYALLFPVVASLMVLAMGSKEIALTIPLLSGILILRVPKRGMRERLTLLVFVGVLLLGFFAWRLHCLNGMGFMPGQAVPGRANAAPFTLTKWAGAMAKSLLPAPINPLYGVSLLTAAAGFVAVWLFLFQQTIRGRAIVFLASLLALNALMENALLMFVAEPYFRLFAGMATLALVFFVVWNRPADAVFLLAFGLAAYVPLYHIVYNAVGNVTYLPETYWAFANAALFTAALDSARQSEGLEVRD